MHISMSGLNPVRLYLCLLHMNSEQSLCVNRACHVWVMFSDVFKEYFKMLLTGKQKFQKRIWNGHPSNPRMYANVL